VIRGACRATGSVVARPTGLSLTTDRQKAPGCGIAFAMPAVGIVGCHDAKNRRSPEREGTSFGLRRGFLGKKDDVGVRRFWAHPRPVGWRGLDGSG